MGKSKNTMQTLRKVFAISVIFVTVLSLSFSAVPAFAAASAGDLIKMKGLSSVYYLGGDGKRYVFPNEQTYFSWYRDFSSVMTIPQAELEGYPLGANVTVRPGTKLVKITTNPNVYAVEPGGNLRKIGSEAQAIALFGANWAKRVIDVPDAFFTNYKTGSDLPNGVYPIGSLVKLASAPDVLYYDGTNYRKVETEAAFNANRFNWNDVVTTSLAIVAGGTSISGAVSAYTDTSSGAGGTAYVGGSGLTVGVSGATAPAATIVIGQALADIASFNLTAANDGAVKLTSVKFKRLGISGDGALSNIYLYDGNTRLTDAGSMSSGVITFSDGAGIVTVPAGQTKTLSVRSDIAGSAGNTIGLSINAAADVVAGGANVTGAFPANGNLMSIAQPDSSVLGTAALGASPTSAGNINAGTNQVLVWSESMTVAVKAAKLKVLSLKQVGTAPYDAFQNYKLFVDGVQAGSAVTLAATDGTVNLDVSASPVDLQTGSHTFEVRADSVKGSSRTYQFSLQTSADIVLTETGYGVNITPTGTFPFKPTAAANINNGSLSVNTDTALANTQVVKGSAAVALGRWTVKAYGEDMKVTTLTVVPSVATTSGALAVGEGLSNVSIFVNGAQVGSSKNYLATTGGVFSASTLVFGTTNLFTVKANETVTLEVRADLTQNTTSYISSVDANLRIEANAVQGVTSIQTWPAAQQNYSGQAALTVVTGSMTASKATDFQNQNVLANTQKTKVGSFKLQAGNAEDVNVTSLAVGLATSTVPRTEMTNLYITYDTVTSDPVVPQDSNNFSATFSIPANQVKTVNVYVDLSSNAIVGSTTVTFLTVNYRGSKTNTSATASVQGQTITIAQGSLATPTLVSNAPTAQLVGGNSSFVAATYKFVATNGSATINELRFNVVGSATTSPNGTSVSSVTVGGQTGTVVFDGTNYKAIITGLALVVPAGSSGLQVPVTVQYNPVTSSGLGGETTRTAVGLNLTYYKSVISNVTSETNTNVASNVMYLVGSIPTVAKTSDSPTQASGFSGGNTDVLHFTVTAPMNQPVNLKAVGFTPVYSGTMTATSTQLVKIYDSTDLNTVLNGSGTAIGNSGQQGTAVFTNDFLIAGGTTKTFVVYADCTGTWTAASFRLDLTATGDTGISTGTNWQWNDTTVATYGNGYLVKNLPVTGGNFAK